MIDIYYPLIYTRRPNKLNQIIRSSIIQSAKCVASYIHHQEG